MPATPNRHLAVAAALGIAAIAAVWCCFRSDPEPPVRHGAPGPSAPGPTPAATEPPAAAPAPVGEPTFTLANGETRLPQPAAATQPTAGFIEFPDGSSYPPLNGVRIAPRIAFHALAPFAKVIGIVQDASGRQWYVHENGVRSTTYVGPTGEATGLVARPVPTLPVLDEGTAPRK